MSMHINTCSFDLQTARGRTLRFYRNSNFRALMTNSTIRNPEKLSHNGGLSKSHVLRPRAHQVSKIKITSQIQGRSRACMLTDPFFILPLLHSYHREATHCRLHFPGWFLAGFRQWGHWVGTLKESGEEGRVGKMGVWGAGCSQGSSPRIPLPQCGLGSSFHRVIPVPGL